MRQHNAGDASLGAGATPLMRAAKALDLEVMKTLLDHRADPSRALANGTTTLMVALTGRGSRTLTPETPMFQAVRLLLERGADVNATAANGATLLHQSVDRGRRSSACSRSEARSSTLKTPAVALLSTSHSASRRRLRQAAAPAARREDPAPHPCRRARRRSRSCASSVRRADRPISGRSPPARVSVSTATTSASARALRRRASQGSWSAVSGQRTCPGSAAAR